MTEIFIGTSGWNYKGWKNDFYKNIPQTRWLSFYSEKFNSVEVNATFYRNLKTSVYEKWTSITSENFWFVVKGSRQITHLNRLKGNIKDLILKQKENLSPLLIKTKAILWQLPPGLKKDIYLLENFIKILKEYWEEILHVIEFRNKTWFKDDISDILTKHNICNCISDSPKWPMWEEVISNAVYIRLHGHEKLYHSKYTEEELKEWAKKIKTWIKKEKTIFVFFDNTDSGAAPYDALCLKKLLSC